MFTFDAGEVASKLGISQVLGTQVLGKFGFLAPDFVYHDSCKRVAQHIMLLAAILSVIIYKTMISKRRQTMAKKMAIAGAIIVLLLVTPYIYFDTMGIEQSAVRQPFVMGVIMSMFRTIEGKICDRIYHFVTLNCFLTNYIIQLCLDSHQKELRRR